MAQRKKKLFIFFYNERVWGQKCPSLHYEVTKLHPIFSIKFYSRWRGIFHFKTVLWNTIFIYSYTSYMQKNFWEYNSTISRFLENWAYLDKLWIAIKMMMNTPRVIKKLDLKKMKINVCLRGDCLAMLLLQITSKQKVLEKVPSHPRKTKGPSRA